MVQQKLLADRVDNRIGRVFDTFVEEVKSRSAGEKKKYLEKAGIALKTELNQTISEIGFDFKKEITRLIKQYGQNMEEVRSHWNEFLLNSFQIKKPFLAKIPSIVWDGLEIWLYTFVVPFGWIGAIVARLVGKQFFSPVPGLADWLIDNQVEKGIEESKNKVCDDIKTEMNSVIQKTFAEIKNGMEESNHAQVKAIRDALAANPVASGDRSAFESAKTDLEAALAAL